MMYCAPCFTSNNIDGFWRKNLQFFVKNFNFSGTGKNLDLTKRGKCVIIE